MLQISSSPIDILCHWNCIESTEAWNVQWSYVTIAGHHINLGYAGLDFRMMKIIMLIDMDQM